MEDAPQAPLAEPGQGLVVTKRSPEGWKEGGAGWGLYQFGGREEGKG